ncbi:MAG: hypothetical protein AAB569_07080 [Patescibacteria group bacterium]
MGAGDCGSAGDQSRSLSDFPSGDKALAVWTLGELQAFNQPVNQSDSQTPNQPTGHSVSRPNFQTPHALANRSGIFHLRPVESGLRWTRPPP